MSAFKVNKIFHLLKVLDFFFYSCFEVLEAEHCKQRDFYLPIWRVSPRKMAPIKAAIEIPTGLNMATNTGPFLRMHHATTPYVTTFPNTAFKREREPTGY